MKTKNKPPMFTSGYRKMPGPRDEEDKHSQMYAALGVGFVCVVIGIPLWWKTTEVYRVSLPYSDIAGLSNTKIQFSVELEVINTDEKLADIVQLSSILSAKLESSEESDIAPFYRLNVRDVTPEETAVIHKFKSLTELDKVWSSQENEVNQYKVLLLPSNNKFGVTNPYIGMGRIIYVTSNKDVSQVSERISTIFHEVIIKTSIINKSFDARMGDRTLKPDKESMRSVRSHPGYDITFSLVNPQPDILDVQWDIQQAVKVYLDPLASQLKDYVNLNIQSQYLYFTGLLRRPTQNSDGFQYSEKDLPHTINPLETRLGSYTSSNPALNFLLYVPSRDQHPLYLVNDAGAKIQSNAFLSPRWGGIYIHNVNVPQENATLPIHVRIDLKTAMEVFLSQIRLLLNFHTHISANVDVADPGNKVIRQWELDNWLRTRCAENLGTAIATLQSLAQLLEEISNIVIQDDIGEQVQKAVESILESQRHLQDGRLDRAFLESRKAIQCSEKAFFDPSLLELLYFPEDQKFAIYIPLFLPISLPVVASLWKAVRWMKNQRKQKQE